MRDCHSIVGLYTYQNRVPFAPSLRWVSCKERDRLPHEGANFHSSFVHYPIFDIYANVQGRDLGAVAREIDQVVAAFTPKLPQGSSLVVRGQVESMRSAFSGLSAGVVFAVVLVYFLMAVNFQSWL